MDMPLRASDNPDVERAPRDQAMMSEQLAKAVMEWDTVAAELLPREAAWTETVVVGLSLVQRASELFEKILAVMPPSRAGHSSVEILAGGHGSYSEEVRRASRSEAQTALADIAFIAKLECRQLQKTLRQLDGGSPPGVFIEACQRTRRRVLKALTALVRAIRSRLGDSGIDDSFVDELARSLACRRVLSALWTRIEATAEQPVLRRLRLAGTAVAMLQGNDAYYDLRLGDRLMLRVLQDRILQWLRSPTRDQRGGEALSQDLLGFASLSRRINDRSELIEHDRFVIERALTECHSLLESDAPAMTQALARLKSLVGLSANFDALLLADTLPTPSRLREVLRAAVPASSAPADLTGNVDEFERAESNAGSHNRRR
ncbi:MAG: hypothetical protein JKY37_24040 [Nannocystaceae bacterium]|nr:hypothetical protein [Nannocystaceae bacterium]